MQAPGSSSLLAVLSCGPEAEAWPIEVAWLADGETRSMLIKPASTWSLCSWDKGYEGKHRLPLEQLLSEGKSALEACLVLNAALGGRTVGVATPETDCVWLYKLYKAAEVQPNFRLTGLEDPPPPKILRATDAVARLQDRAASDQTV
jgi:hypothetical protein